jgi:hypothetical protein
VIVLHPMCRLVTMVSSSTGVEDHASAATLSPTYGLTRSTLTYTPLSFSSFSLSPPVERTPGRGPCTGLRAPGEEETAVTSLHIGCNTITRFDIKECMNVSVWLYSSSTKATLAALNAPWWSSTGTASPAAATATCGTLSAFGCGSRRGSTRRSDSARAVFSL